MSTVIIGRDQRLAVVGKTGTGKTYLLRALAAPVTRLVVIDSKGTLGGEDWNLAPWTPKTAFALAAGKPVRLRVLAPMDGDYEPFFSAVYNAGDCVLVIDELFAVSDRGKFGPWLQACYTRGRELKVGVWAAMQRPSWVPLMALSEADYYVCFRLQLEEDRRRMAAFMGPQVEAPVRDKYGFWLYSTEWENPRYARSLEVRESRRREAIVV